MTIAIYQVDAFTDKSFSGNPAAVCILPKPKDARWMQNVAREMNLSETAFLHRIENGFNLRWFTPAVEVELCGHATLASAHILWEMGLLEPDKRARFHTRSGLLTAEHKGDLIELDFPSRPQSPSSAEPGLIEALGIQPVYVGKCHRDILMEVESEQEVRGMQPDFGKLKSLHVRGIMVTSLSSTAEYDFISRFFAPGAGIDEDPVTGAAHCCLGPFWSKRLGKNRLFAYQASPRGGELYVRVAGERVFIGGKAVTIMRGELVTH